MTRACMVFMVGKPAKIISLILFKAKQALVMSMPLDVVYALAIYPSYYFSCFL